MTTMYLEFIHALNSSKGIHAISTGKCLSEGLIFASTDPQYDNRLFIEFQGQTWGEHVLRSGLINVSNLIF